MKEVWKDLLEFEGHYKVSNLGRVKTVKKKWSQCKHPECILSPEKTRLGYLRLNLYKDNKRTRLLVHRCVSQAFRLKGNGTEINHLNGIKSDNRVTNLEWSTRSNNMKHAFQKGLIRPMVGESNPTSKYSDKQVKRVIDLS
jgi:hypothetical protein